MTSGKILYPSKTIVIRRPTTISVLFITLLLLFLCSCSKGGKGFYEWGSKSKALADIRIPTPEEEFGVIWHTLNNINFYEKHGYEVSLPAHDQFIEMARSSEELSYTVRKKLYDIFVKQIYRKKDYEKGLQVLEGTRETILLAFEKFADLNSMWGFKIFDRYEILLTLYGIGGQYNSKSGKVILKTTPDGNFMSKNPAHTIVNKMVHIGIDKNIVQKYKLSQEEKERIVDLICYYEFNDILKNYEMYSREDLFIKGCITQVSMMDLPFWINNCRKNQR